MALEQNLKELEDIAEKLECGGVSLDEGIKLYEKGIELTKRCLADLNASKDKISAIKEEMAKLTDKTRQEG